MAQVTSNNLTYRNDCSRSRSNKLEENVNDTSECELVSTDNQNIKPQEMEVTTIFLDHNDELPQFLYVCDFKLVKTSFTQTGDVLLDEESQCEMCAFCFVAEERFDSSIEWFYAPLKEYDRKKLHVQASVVSVALEQALENIHNMNDEKCLERTSNDARIAPSEGKVVDETNDNFVERINEDNDDEQSKKNKEICNTETNTHSTIMSSLPNIYFRIGGTNTFRRYELVECKQTSESCEDKYSVYSSCNRSNKNKNKECNDSKFEPTLYSLSVSTNANTELNGLTFLEGQSSYEEAPLQLLWMQENDTLHKVVECGEVEIQRGNENEVLMKPYGEACPSNSSNLCSPNVSNIIALASRSKCNVDHEDHDDDDGWRYIFAPIKDAFSYRRDFPDGHNHETSVEDDDDADTTEINIRGNEPTDIRRLSTSCQDRHECGCHHNMKKWNDNNSSSNSSRKHERHEDMMEIDTIVDRLGASDIYAVENINGICQENNSYNSDTDEEDVIDMEDIDHYYRTLRSKYNGQMRYKYDDEICVNGVDNVKDNKNREGDNNFQISEGDQLIVDTDIANVSDTLNTSNTNNIIYYPVKQRGVTVSSKKNSATRGCCSYVFVPSSLPTNLCEWQTSSSNLQLEHSAMPEGESESNVQSCVDNSTVVVAITASNHVDGDHGDSINNDNRQNCGEPVWHGQEPTHRHRLWTPRASLSSSQDISSANSYSSSTTDNNDVEKEEIVSSSIKDHHFNN